MVTIKQIQTAVREMGFTCSWRSEYQQFRVNFPGGIEDTAMYFDRDADDILSTCEITMAHYKEEQARLVARAQQVSAELQANYAAMEAAYGKHAVGQVEETAAEEPAEVVEAVETASPRDTDGTRYVIVKMAPNVHWNLDYVTGYSAKIVSHAYQTPDLPFYLAGRMEREIYGDYGPDYTDPTYHVAKVGDNRFSLFDRVYPKRYLSKMDAQRELEEIPF